MVRRNSEVTLSAIDISKLRKLTNKGTMNKLVSILAIGFFAFIVWIIYLANTGAESIFFDFVRSIPYGDKIGHVGLIGTLTLLAVVALKFKSIKVRSVAIYYGVALVFAFVLIEELSQLFIPSRTFDLVDMTANIVGIGAAALLCYWLHKFMAKRTS